jgi:hypothetical protein
MAVKVKRGAVKVGKKYIEAGETVSGLSKDEEQALVSNGTAEYIPEQTKEPETGDENSKGEGNEKKSGTTDSSDNSEKAAKNKAK